MTKRLQREWTDAERQCGIAPSRAQPFWCRLGWHTSAHVVTKEADGVYAERCLSCDAIVDLGPWCDVFVPWSCMDVVDEDLDSCDCCGSPKAAHPVMNEADEDYWRDHNPAWEGHEDTEGRLLKGN